MKTPEWSTTTDEELEHVTWYGPCGDTVRIDLSSARAAHEVAQRPLHRALVSPRCRNPEPALKISRRVSMHCMHSSLAPFASHPSHLASGVPLRVERAQGWPTHLARRRASIPSNELQLQIRGQARTLLCAFTRRATDATQSTRRAAGLTSPRSSTAPSISQ